MGAGTLALAGLWLLGQVPSDLVYSNQLNHGIAGAYTGGVVVGISSLAFDGTNAGQITSGLVVAAARPSPYGGSRVRIFSQPSALTTVNDPAYNPFDDFNAFGQSLGVGGVTFGFGALQNKLVVTRLPQINLPVISDPVLVPNQHL